MTDHDRPEHDTSAPRTGDEAPTERLETTPTERIESGREGPGAHPRPAGAHVAPEPSRVPEPSRAPESYRAPERPSGPHAPTILLALICLAVAGLAIARQVTGFTGLTWSGSGPAIIVGAGVVLLAVGVLGLVRDRRDPGRR